MHKRKEQSKDEGEVCRVCLDFATMTKIRKSSGNRESENHNEKDEGEDSEEEDDYNDEDSSDIDIDHETEEKGTLMVVVKDSSSKAVRAHALRNKSIRDSYATRKLCADLEEWGHNKVILKSDGEPAIRALKKKVKTKRGEAITLMEVTPRADPRANGDSESAVREIKGVARAIKTGLEQRLKRIVPADSPILP